jgi:hypothetical protein
MLDPSQYPVDDSQPQPSTQPGTQDLEDQNARNRQMYINLLLSRQQDAAQQQGQPPSMQQPQQAQPPANNAQNAGPVKTGLRHVLLGVLQSFSYGAGQAALKASGLETDAEKTARLTTQAHMQADTNESNARTQLYGIQAQLEQRKAQMFQNFFSGQGGVKDPAEDLGQLAPYEKAQLDAARTESALKGDLQDYYAAIKDIRDTRAQHQGIPLSDTGIQQINSGNTRRWQLLHPGQDLPSEYTLQANSTDKDATRVVGLLDSEEKALNTQNQNALGNLEKRSTIAKNNLESQKTQLELSNLQQQPIFAVDPRTNERVMTTRPEAQANGYTNPVAITEGAVSKETDARAMINDVQLNKSRYLTAMNKVYSEPMTTAQKTALVSLAPEHLGIDLGKYFSLELPDVMQKVTNATAFSQLSPSQKQAVVGYYATLASVPAAQKALTNTGRGNKEMMDLELRTIPTPLMDKGTFGAMLDRFQGNIDQTAHKTVRLPGMPSTADIRGQYEGTAQPRKFPSVNVRALRKAIGEKVE